MDGIAVCKAFVLEELVVRMYHERQSQQMCLVHALNALFQKPQFTAKSLDEICYTLNDSRWFNPHRMSVDRICFDKLHALIVNVPTKSFLPLWKGRHWYTILRLDNGKLINLDSKLSQPEEIHDIYEHCRRLLMKTGDANQLFLVVEL
ncbi:hypothetical protein DICVIV_13391 [Dictyocaulus viviparus]|uniref:ubiquitinyl hydrolase 1 n=1 Tax=Dictyocaulus viviparus TaxID=29172 RepID=A0A0D8XAH9_DICVI|nr:hypothetical protein DICVIV_13391 [Dictyocaulus viviparus]